MPEDNQIRDAFHNSSLENEDWLQPSDIVFDNIETELYGKKKRRWFIYWWIPVLSLLLLGALTTYMYWPTANNSQISTLANNSAKVTSNTSKTNHSEQTAEAKESNYLANKEINKPVDILDQKQAINQASNNTTANNKKANTPSLNAKQSSKATQTNNDYNKKGTSSLGANHNSQISNSNTISYHESTTHSTQKEFSGHFQATKEIALANSKNNLNTSKTHSNKNTTNKINAINATTTIVSKLRVIELPLWDKTEPKKELDLITTPPSTAIDLPIISPWALNIHTAASFWNFKLNQDYRDALQAADFNHNVGKGFLVSLGLERKMTKVISLKTQFSFERITFESGHNSGISYDPNTEGENQANDFDLTMASPIGFLKSNISVERTNDEITEATELIIDLNNSHQITNLDWGLSGLAQLINRSNFSSAIELGGGVQYLGNIKNELYQFSTSDGFNSKSAKITEDQNELNKIRPYAFGGIHLGYQFGLKNSIQLQYLYKQDLQNIYEGGDFSTRLNRQQIGFSFKKVF